MEKPINLEPAICTHKNKKEQMNSRLPPIVFNGFIKPDILEQLIEYVVSIVKRKNLKAGLYHFYDFII